MAASDDGTRRPTTPTPSTTVASASTAASSSKQAQPPPASQHRRKPGSSTTIYYPPATEPPARPLLPSPPAYDVHASNALVPYREPIGLPTSPTASIPELVEASPATWPEEQAQGIDYSGWEAAGNEWPTQDTQPGWGTVQPSWGGTTAGYSGWADATPQEMTGVESTNDNWWDQEEAAWAAKPGPGCLPPSVALRLHGGERILYKVTVTPPDIQAEGPPPPKSPVQHFITPAAVGPSSTSPASSSHPLPPPPPPQLASHAPPTPEEVRLAVPHPYAQFCPGDNVWVYHQVRSSIHLPDMLPRPANSLPIPEQSARKASASCIDLDATGVTESLVLSSNHVKTHHFHHYPNAVKGSSLSPPFTKNYFGALQRRKGRKASSASSSNAMDISVDKPVVDAADEILLDIWICCQCQTHIIASGVENVIPGIVDPPLMKQFLRRYQDPPVGKTYAMALAMALDTLLRILDNFLWKLIPQAVKVGSSIQNRVGWNEDTKEVFRLLGFNYYMHSPSNGAPVGRLDPPKLKDGNPEAPLLRARLLRGWLELSALAKIVRKRYRNDFSDNDTGYRVWASVENTDDEMLRQIGAHPQQLKRIPKGVLENIPRDLFPEWERLGTTADTHSAELVTYAYRRQTYCSPTNTPSYYNSLTLIFNWAVEVRHSSQEGLSDLYVMEMSRGRWSTTQLQQATEMLSLPSPYPDNYDPAPSLRDAWLAKVKEANAAFAAGTLKKEDLDKAKQDLKEAYRIVSEASGRKNVVITHEMTLKMYGNGMYDVNEAYAALEVPRELDDEMVITVYSMRVEDQPSAADRMRTALLIIAEDRGSERLKNLALTGTDVGPPPPESSRIDWPRGLQQLGNTCYLNSLLQYFYTIKDLRVAITASAEADASVAVSDEDIKQDRVGGRLVTRREVERSKKFVGLLRDLFWQLECSQDAAIKPEVELAKLALVTSKDEEDEVKSEGSDATNASSVQSGSTLVDEPMPMGPLPEIVVETKPLPSVLGKRPGDALDLERRHTTMNMDISSPDLMKDGFIVVEQPRRSTMQPEHTSTQVPEDVDIIMEDPASDTQQEKANPPPLPPRKKPERGNDSVMMFGKQHDVSECMDNCMFQIEAALKFGIEKSGMKPNENYSSIVKQLFYGKVRQRIEVSEEGSNNPSVHEKEDLFSQLLVNVADEGFDLYDGLTGHFDDTVEFEGRQGRMETSISELPPLLQIQLQRVQFNRDTLEAYKSNAYVKFDESIFMDRFLSSANPEKKARSRELQRDLQATRERLSKLTKGKGVSFERSLTNTYNMLAEQTFIPIDPTVLSDLQRESDLLKGEIAECRKKATALKAALENLWKDERKVEYELSSVFIHRGSSPSFGHYFFYGRDLPDNPDRWLKYNDQDVSTIPKSEVLMDTTGSTANPYLLVYARKGSNVMQTVHRTNLEDLSMNDP